MGSDVHLASCSVDSGVLSVGINLFGDRLFVSNFSTPCI